MDKNINNHIGRRLKALRVSQKVSQNDVARILGISFQQVQKYENGCNRISAASLYKISNFFHISLSYFFEDIDQSNCEDEKLDSKIFYTKETLDLVSNFNEVKNSLVRKNIISLLSSLQKVEF